MTKITLTSREKKQFMNMYKSRIKWKKEKSDLTKNIQNQNFKIQEAMYTNNEPSNPQHLS